MKILHQKEHIDNKYEKNTYFYKKEYDKSAAFKVI